MTESETFLNQLTAALVPKHHLYKDMINDASVQMVYRSRDWVIARCLLSVSTVASLTDLRAFALEVREDVKQEVSSSLVVSRNRTPNCYSPYEPNAAN